MGDDRTFSPEEVRALLERASELQARGLDRRLTLDEVRRVAEQAGIDPDAVDRARRELQGTPAAVRVDVPWLGPSVVQARRFFDERLSTQQRELLWGRLALTDGETGRLERNGTVTMWSGRPRSPASSVLRAQLHENRAGASLEVTRESRSRAWVPLAFGLCALLVSFVVVTRMSPLLGPATFVVSVALWRWHQVRRARRDAARLRELMAQLDTVLARDPDRSR